MATNIRYIGIDRADLVADPDVKVRYPGLDEVNRPESESGGIDEGATFPANPSDGDLFNIIGSTDASVTDNVYRYRTSTSMWELLAGSGSGSSFFGSTIETFRVTDGDFRYHSFLTVTSTSGSNVSWAIVLRRVNRGVTPRTLQTSTGDGTNALTGTGTVAQAQAAFDFYDTTAELSALTWT